jgi:hypothetical protein
VEDLTVDLGTVPRYVCSIQDAEFAVDQVQQSILSAYYRNCPVRVAHSLRGVLWWNKALRDLKTQTRRLFSRVKMTGEWGLYKEYFTRYKRDQQSQKVLMEEVLPADRGCTRQCQTHEDHGETSEQQDKLGEAT